jgi:hypothetical protein
MIRITIALLCLLFAGPAAALKTTTAPADPPVVESWTLQEVWRLDNEMDEDLPLMGVIATGEVTDDGHVFVLDKQLAQVLEIAPDGSYVQTLGRPGQGPGELEQPNMVIVTPDERIGLIQVFPGKVVFLHRGGTPAGSFQTVEGPNTIFLRYREANGVHIASSRTMAVPGTGIQENRYFLRSYDEQGEDRHLFFEGGWTTYYDPPSIAESGTWFCSATWDLQDDGTLVVAPRRDEYRIEWIGPDGEVKRVVTRPLAAHVRTAEERKNTEDGLRVWGNGVELPAKKTILDTEPLIRGLQILADGTIWIRTCYAERDLPDGVYIRYDVFSPEGEFLREVRVVCDVDRDKDYWGLLRDGTFLHFVNASSALDAMYASVDPNEENADEEIEREAEEEYLIVRRLRPLR